MPFREARTIEAIGEWRQTYPYAAALLGYVVVERVLQRYVPDHWTDSSLASATVPKKIETHRGKQLVQLRHLPRRQRLHDVRCEMTLDQVETLLGCPKSKRSATDRNEVVHSNLYLKRESTLTTTKQRAKNEARFVKAFGHLRRALDQYEDLAIVERRGRLLAQLDKRLDQPSTHASKETE